MNGELLGEKRKLIITVVAVGIILALFLVAKTAGEIKQYGFIGKDVPAMTTISVFGKGEKVVTPDIAEFTFSVIKEAKTVSDAQAAATKTMNSAIAAVRDMGVEERDIKTVGYNIYPKYEYRRTIALCNEWGCPPGEQVLVGYEVSQNILVKVRKIEDAGAILSKIGTVGVSSVSGLTFSTDDEDAAKTEARALAIGDAQEKAKVLAEQLGVKLVRVVSFYESGDSPIYYAKEAAFGLGGGDAVAPVPDLPTGENTILSNVTITYEIQ